MIASSTGTERRRNWRNFSLLKKVGSELFNADKMPITSEPLMNSIKHVSKAEPVAKRQPAASGVRWGRSCEMGTDQPAIGRILLSRMVNRRPLTDNTANSGVQLRSDSLSVNPPIFVNTQNPLSFIQLPISEPEPTAVAT